jgi:hypothetical protein
MVLLMNRTLERSVAGEARLRSEVPGRYVWKQAGEGSI